MTKKEIRKELALLKMQFGDGLIPQTEFLASQLKEVGVKAELSYKGYIIPSFESIEDDEGIRHGFTRGYKFTEKAYKLLRHPEWK